MQPLEPRFVPVAEHSVLVEFGDDFDEEAHGSVLALDRSLEPSRVEGLLEVVPALVNLLVRFDPLLTDHDRIESAVREVLTDQPPERTLPRRHEVAVCYHESVAPDLNAVADACRMSPQGVIDAHLAEVYRVLMYGFAPGYAYLDGMPPKLRLPRKPVPVRDVPAGSLAIAGPQCLVTTLDMPTGWWVIGRSPTTILDPTSPRPYLFDLGDEVLFRQISLVDLERR